jgi:hypothetical protein
MAKARSKRAIKIVEGVTEMPMNVTFDASGEELVFDRFIGAGPSDTAIYRYVRSHTKLGREIQLTARQINSRYKNTI